MWEKLAQGIMDDGKAIRHDLDEALELLIKHRENGYKGLTYQTKRDGDQGIGSVTINFPKASEVAKYDAMVKDQVPVPEANPEVAKPEAEVPAEALVPAEPMPAKASSKVVVRVAMEAPQKMLKEKYPAEFVKNLGLS
jgi:hypothetical protein